MAEKEQTYGCPGAGLHYFARAGPGVKGSERCHVDFPLLGIFAVGKTIERVELGTLLVLLSRDQK